MSPAGTFDEYLASLGRLTPYVDPTIPTAESSTVRDAAASLGALDTIDVDTLTEWVHSHPRWAPVLGLAVGLSQEKLKNALRVSLGSSGWITLARKRPYELIAFFDGDYQVVQALTSQIGRTFDFADILIARAGSRVTATQSLTAGRLVENKITDIADELGLPYVPRSSFIGKGGAVAPADLIVPNGDDAKIVVAAKGFDSTGSKLTAAFKEIEDVANVRFASQHVFAVVDGIGWHSRQKDLRRIHHLWSAGHINGLYTLETLGQFRIDLEEAARFHKLI